MGRVRGQWTGCARGFERIDVTFDERDSKDAQE